MSKIITPAQVQAKFIASLPPFVVEILSDKIQDGWNGSESTVYLDELETRVTNRVSADSSFGQYNYLWLTAALEIAEAEWSVQRYSPDRGEQGRTYYNFTPKSKKN